MHAWQPHGLGYEKKYARNTCCSSVGAVFVVGEVLKTSDLVDFIPELLDATGRTVLG
jgi:hypothetical protein